MIHLAKAEMQFPLRYFVPNNRGGGDGRSTIWREREVHFSYREMNHYRASVRISLSEYSVLRPDKMMHCKFYSDSKYVKPRNSATSTSLMTDQIALAFYHDEIRKKIVSIERDTSRQV